MNQKTPAKATHTNSYQVEVRLKSEFTDSEGLAALSILNGLGLNTARELRTSQIYAIRGPLGIGNIQQAAKELLSDAVTQEYRLIAPSAAFSNGMSHWRIEVWLKDSVTDSVGDTVRSAFVEMGLPTPQSVRVATAYRITGKCGKNQLERIIPRCLANPIIHRFIISETHP